VLGPKTNLEHILGMFFRDDITSWLFRRVGGAGQIKLAQLKALVAANTETCIARIRQARLQPKLLRAMLCHAMPSCAMLCYGMLCWSIHGISACRPGLSSFTILFLAARSPVFA